MAKEVKKKAEGGVDKKVKNQKNKPSKKESQKAVKSKKIDAAKKKVSKKPDTSPSLGWWERGKQYLREVVYELRKVVWPSRKETVASTSVVLVVVILIGIFLGCADLILTRVMRWVIG